MEEVHWLSSTAQPVFLNQCWRTSFFKDKALHDPWLRSILQRLARRPHALGQKSDPRERYMFSTFWNVWIFHDNDNDYIYDLGILHEFIHTVLFEKKRAWGSTPQAWAEGPLITMENAVSLRTEVMVYHRWPSLRKHTFEQPIWADTLMQSSWPVIKAQRKRIQNTSPQERSNLTPEEQRIAGYVNFNQNWGQLWTDAGITIEAAWQYTYNHPDETQEVFEKVWASHEQHGIPFYHLMP